MRNFITANRTAVGYGVIALMLLIKLAAFRYIVLGDASFVRLLLLEFPVWMLLLSIIFFTIKRVSPLLALLYNGLISALLVSMVWYERYFLIVPSYFDLKQSGQAESVMETVTLLASPWDLLFFADAIVYIVLLVLFRKAPLHISRKASGLAALAFLVLTAATSAWAMQKPLLDVTLFAKEQGFVQTQFAQAYTRSNVTYAEELLSDIELEELKGNTFVPYEMHDRFGVAEGRHVFTIQVESLQAFAINETIDGQEITPHLNDLLQDSLYFDRMFQQIGAGNTSDAEWLLHTSIYPKGLEPTVNFLDGEDVPSLVHLLNDRDYYTTTYHADDIKYWNRNRLYPALGFQRVYTNKDIPDADIVGFGPSDQVLMDYAKEQVKEQAASGSRIYANLLTLTSHTPFEMPVPYEYLDLPEHFEDTYTGNYLQSVRYADEAVGSFIEFLKEEGLYEESLIVVNGDHSGLHGTPMTVEDTELMGELLGHRYSLKDRFRLPFIVAAPGLFQGETVSHLGGQLDMLPTILNLLGIVPESPIVGHNMLQYENNLISMRYYLPGGSFITNEEMFLARNARYPDRYYEFETMEKQSDIPDYVQQKQLDAQKILDHSDTLLSRYANEEQ